LIIDLADTSEFIARLGFPCV